MTVISIEEIEQHKQKREMETFRRAGDIFARRNLVRMQAIIEIASKNTKPEQYSTYLKAMEAIDGVLTIAERAMQGGGQ